MFGTKLTFSTKKNLQSMLKHTEFEINPLESDFLLSNPPSLWNFQFPPWWGYEYFQEPHNIGF